MAKVSLPALPSLPSSSRVRPQVKCACGCGQLTSRTWFPGHDARQKGILLRVVSGVMTLAEVKSLLGSACHAAVVRDLGDSALLRRWSIEVPAEFKAAQRASRKSGPAVVSEVSEPDAAEVAVAKVG